MKLLTGIKPRSSITPQARSNLDTFEQWFLMLQAVVDLKNSTKQLLYDTVAHLNTNDRSFHFENEKFY